MIISIANLDEQLKNFKSTHQREQTAEQIVEYYNYYINKKRMCYQEWDSQRLRPLGHPDL